MPNPVTVDTVLPGYRLGTDQGRVAFCGVNLIQGADEAGAPRYILIDTGHSGRREQLEAELGRRGIGPSDIDVLVCTHAHWDHIENLYLFRRAQILIHQNERRYARRPHENDFGCPPWIGSVLDLFQDRITQVQEGTQIIPGVRIVDAPGHSAGSMAVAAATADGVAVIAGDAIQNSVVAVQRRNALVFWDDILASRTISKLVEIADIIYPGHDQAFRIDARNKAEYVQRFRLTLTYLSPSQPGLSFDENPGPDHFVMPGIEQQTLPDLDDQERRDWTQRAHHNASDLRQIRTFTLSTAMHQQDASTNGRLPGAPGHNRRDQLRGFRLITAVRPALSRQRRFPERSRIEGAQVRMFRRCRGCVRWSARRHGPGPGGSR